MKNKDAELNQDDLPAKVILEKAPIKITMGNQNLWLDTEGVEKEQDVCHWCEYVMSKYRYSLSEILDEDSFNNWKLKGKPKARLWM